MDGVENELSLFDLSGWLLGTAQLERLAPGGVFAVTMAADKAQGMPVGRTIRFQCRLRGGEVRGLAEVVPVEPRHGALGLRLLELDNEGGLPHLMDFVYTALAR